MKHSIEKYRLIAKANIGVDGGCLEDDVILDLCDEVERLTKENEKMFDRLSSPGYKVDGCTCGEGCDYHIVPNQMTRHNSGPNRMPPYPRCPECGSSVVGAMMTSRSITSNGKIYYHPEAISVYCESGDCNWDRKLNQIPSPSKEGSEDHA